LLERQRRREAIHSAPVGKRAAALYIRFGTPDPKEPIASSQPALLDRLDGRCDYDHAGASNINIAVADGAGIVLELEITPKIEANPDEERRVGRHEKTIDGEALLLIEILNLDIRPETSLSADVAPPPPFPLLPDEATRSHLAGGLFVSYNDGSSLESRESQQHVCIRFVSRRRRRA
jgi:hypothetical protein